VTVAGLIAVTAPWDRRAATVGLLAVVPVLVWCWLLARGGRVGLPVGAVLVALMAWVVVPRTVGWSGRWLVPSLGDMLTWYPWLAAAICAIGVAAERRHAGRPDTDRAAKWSGYVLGVLVVVVAGCVTCPLWWIVDLEAPPGDEGLLPMPAGLHVVEELECGSGGCARALTITGDRADARVRAHLAARGYRIGSAGTARRDTGVLIPHHVRLGYRVGPDGAVRIVWSVPPVVDL